jgi:hypothetical protein
MPKDKKYNPVAITEGFILLVIVIISVISTIVLAVYNYFQH